MNSIVCFFSIGSYASYLNNLSFIVSSYLCGDLALGFSFFLFSLTNYSKLLGLSEHENRLLWYLISAGNRGTFL